jgi:hypothetical protein
MARPHASCRIPQDNASASWPVRLLQAAQSAAQRHEPALRPGRKGALDRLGKMGTSSESNYQVAGRVSISETAYTRSSFALFYPSKQETL